MNTEKRKACVPVYEAEWNEKFRFTKNTDKERKYTMEKMKNSLYYGSPADQTQNFNAP